MGLTQALAAAGFATHLWFVGDPDLPGHDTHNQVRLHRWCQWISRYHPGGVYAGEEGKHNDYTVSLPPFLLREVLLPHLQHGKHAVILAEEWQTVHAVLHLDWLLRNAGVRDQVTIFWNANNTFSFDRIDWHRLAEAAVITTVSRYMKHRMWHLGVNALVIPNGLSADAFLPPAPHAVAEVQARLQDRTVITKVARWDPDKRWLLAIDTIGAMKHLGWHPLLIARGGMEPHGAEVMRAAAAIGLRVVERAFSRHPRALVQALDGLRGVDMLSCCAPLDGESCRVLFQSAAAVLANSGHEPFGLVGLEAMAAGGVVCTGCSGEDYAIPGENALVLETNDPWEFIGLFAALRAHPAQERALRQAGQQTARQYAWPQILQRLLLPRVQLLGQASFPSSIPPRAPGYGESPCTPGLEDAGGAAPRGAAQRCRDGAPRGTRPDGRCPPVSRRTRRYNGEP
jgi:glycosyltransferase involved in cell wall biosynthesis